MIATPFPLVQPEGKLFFFAGLTVRIGDILTIEIVGTILLFSHIGTLCIYPSGNPCQGSAIAEGFSFTSFHQEVLCLSVLHRGRFRYWYNSLCLFSIFATVAVESLSFWLRSVRPGCWKTDNFWRCFIEHVRQSICRASFKFCMGDKLRKELEGGKRDEPFFSALFKLSS